MDASIFQAAAQGDLGTLQKLVDQGADVNQKQTDGATPLILAAQKNHMPLVRYLVECKADTACATKVGGTALNRAAENGNDEMVAFLLDHGTPIGNLALIVAAREGHLPIVERLIQAGADPNVQQAWGYTPLMMAAREGYLDVVRHLLENGANVKTRNKGGETALTLAAENDQVDVVSLLQRAGAKAELARRKRVQVVEEDDEDDDSGDSADSPIGGLMEEGGDDMPEDLSLD